MYRFSRATARFRSVGLVSTLVVLGVQPSAQAVQAQDREFFVEVLGNDTTAIEAFTRTAERWEGRLLLRAPVTRIATYRAELASDGTIQRFEVSWETPPDNPAGPAPRRITFDLSGDSAVVERNDSTGHTVNRYSVPEGTIPTLDKIPWSVGVFRQALHQARAAGGDSVPVWFLGSRTTGAYPNAITKVSADTVYLDFFGSPYLAQMNDAGDILVVNGERTTVKFISRRVDSLDFDALAAEFARRDATGGGLGAMSPRDEVRVIVKGATLTVDYGRPSKRGREIFGALVAWNSVWRTGANAATHFSTDRELGFAGVAVPAGTYTLWTTFTPDSAYLIINSQTQIWGTQYDSAHDLARIPLERATPAMPVERFKISIEETDEGGTLSFAWDDARYWADFAVQVSVAPNAGQASFTPMVEEILAAWDEADVVCLGEAHGRKNDSDLRIALVRHSEFLKRVDAVIVEFANPVHQPILDRFALDGEVVPHEILRLVWRDASSPETWESSIYEAFLRAVREVNLAVSREERVRILGGDTPRDWSRIETVEQLLPYMNRGGWMRRNVAEQVLDRGLKALAVFGASHCRWKGRGFPGELQERYPSRFWVALPLARNARGSAAAAQRLGVDDRPQLVRVRETRRAQMSADGLFTRVDQSTTISQLTDAILYFGDLPEVLVPANLSDVTEADLRETARRDSLRREAARVINDRR